MRAPGSRGAWRRRVKLRLLRAQDDKCLWCGKKLELATATFEHMNPKWNGGSQRQQNLKIACERCNRARGGLPKMEQLFGVNPNDRVMVEI